MPHEPFIQLVEYARNQIGDALRTVAVLYEEDCEVIYLRDDLQTAYSPDQYKRVAGSFRTELSNRRSEAKSSSIGESIATIHYHEDAYVFQFPHDNCHSVLLSVETEVGSRLRSFVEGCQTHM